MIHFTDMGWVAALLGLVLFSTLVAGVLALSYGLLSEGRLRLAGRKIELKGQIEQARIRSAAAIQMEEQNAQLALNAGDGSDAGKKLREQVFAKAKEKTGSSNY
jgi:ribose 1,5-bisphosphokinase PhnN